MPRLTFKPPGMAQMAARGPNGTSAYAAGPTKTRRKFPPVGREVPPRARDRSPPLAPVGTCVDHTTYPHHPYLIQALRAFRWAVYITYIYIYIYIYIIYIYIYIDII